MHEDSTSRLIQLCCWEYAKALPVHEVQLLKNTSRAYSVRDMLHVHIEENLPLRTLHVAECGVDQAGGE